MKHVERHRKRQLIVFDSDSDEDPQLSSAKKRKGTRETSGKCYCALVHSVEEGCNLRGMMWSKTFRE